MQDENSLTGKYLSGKEFIPVPLERRKGDGRKVEIVGAKENNLKNAKMSFPLGTFVAVTGVSGSGKSTMINEVLYKSLAQKLYKAKAKPGTHKEIKGLEHLDKVIDIDQSPIGRTPRSNPATYTGVFDDIRDVFAQTNEAKVRGYQKGRFSFNVKVDVVKRAVVMELLKSKCTSCQMYTCRVKFVMVNVTTVKR